MTRIEGMLRALLGRFRHISPPESPVDASCYGSEVDAYWNAHTVNSVPLGSAFESKRYMEWRFKQYPLYREFMGLWGEHHGETILDYGCGPGDDIAGFLAHTKARKVIGIDISETALRLARARIKLHAIPEDRFTLLQASDADPTIPLDSESIDYVHCGGVLHHSSHPEKVVKEFHRVLRPGGRACIMVYNRESLWYHLYTAYDRMILRGDFPGMTTDAAFALNTDGPVCPIARCYSAHEWIALCDAAGFESEYVGGYLSLRELQLYRQLKAQAVADPRLAAPHREFISGLSLDERGLPQHLGKHAGIGGVYRLRKA